MPRTAGALRRTQRRINTPKVESQGSTSTTYSVLGRPFSLEEAEESKLPRAEPAGFPSGTMDAPAHPWTLHRIACGEASEPPPPRWLIVPGQRLREARATSRRVQARTCLPPSHLPSADASPSVYVPYAADSRSLLFTLVHVTALCLSCCGPSPSRLLASRQLFFCGDRRTCRSLHPSPESRSQRPEVASEPESRPTAELATSTPPRNRRIDRVAARNATSVGANSHRRDSRRARTAASPSREQSRPSCPCRCAASGC